MFQVYTVMLMVSGVLMIVVGAAVSGQSVLMRVFKIIVGLLFFWYGFYLEFIFTGGVYHIYFYAFVLPLLLLARTIRARQAAKAMARVSQYNAPGHPAQPGYYYPTYQVPGQPGAAGGQPVYGSPPSGPDGQLPR
ncbi:MAG TPA: hypothetical protein VJT31_12630 [Rugosimonospora sp.]|nr:hypothetical protein [Rugosimonospora sp.]